MRISSFHFQVQNVWIRHVLATVKTNFIIISDILESAFLGIETDLRDVPKGPAVPRLPDLDVRLDSFES